MSRVNIQQINAGTPEALENSAANGVLVYVIRSIFGNYFLLKPRVSRVVSSNDPRQAVYDRIA